ncbi:MAG TPA: hypothetical protein VFT22_20255, partial [Kofleriaceae bacterium]|nr:hypothetical protein [Kofleriaceae bacterium]
PSEPGPDAAPPSTIPASAAGTFAIASTLDLDVPAVAEPALATLIAATDGPDDPTRYLVDEMIAWLPDGAAKDIAAVAAPYVAAYINARLVEVAPRFVPGIGGIASGLSRIASHFGTVESLRIAEDGTGVRTITGLRFELGGAATVVRLADAGLPDLAASVRVVLDATGRLAIAEHEHALPYGAILRLGLDRAVVPSIEPGARGLAEALAALLDCDRVGAMVADRVGVGSAALYGAACLATMTAIASKVDAGIARVDQTPLGVEVAGSAQALDDDGDGTTDELVSGRWAGAIYAGPERTPIAAASFSGAATHPAPGS